MCKRNGTVKIIQGSKFKNSYEKSGAAQVAPLPMAMTVCYIEAGEWQLFTVQCAVLALIYGTGQKKLY